MITFLSDLCLALQIETHAKYTYQGLETVIRLIIGCRKEHITYYCSKSLTLVFIGVKILKWRWKQKPNPNQENTNQKERC